MEGVSTSGSSQWTDNASLSSSPGSGPSSPFFNPTPQELRKIVLDYLCHHCYVSTAGVLATERSMDEELAARAKTLVADHDKTTKEDSMDTQESGPIVDQDRGFEADMLQTASLRAAIRESILDGNIFAARKILSDHFPTVLNTRPMLSTLPPSTSPLAPSDGSQSTSDTSNTKQEIVDEVQDLAHSCSVSLDPRHLSLNLQIQEFIEGLRTVPLTRTRPDSSSHSFSPISKLLTHSVPQSLSRRAFSPPPPPDTQKLLSQAQELWCLMSELPSPGDKVLYMEELQNVGALMAYEVPETSPVSKYMSMQRREAVAEQINSAVLYRMNQAPLPYLQRYAEHTTAVWKMLEEFGASLPPPSTWPSGIILPPQFESSLKANLTKAHDEDAEMPIPPFDLGRYVGTGPRV
ncbi:hypothetical protein FRB94_006969 [Tulasnella sp. JGI-2019a]|nr:hypothetical protein FRB94_006969 [Tulasnella sp. JGI-2019a]KAG9038889.1 hypothetical protein FRB95_013567 [Tulasnella sp. JGI-2019a]